MARTALGFTLGVAGGEAESLAGRAVSRSALRCPGSRPRRLRTPQISPM